MQEIRGIRILWLMACSRVAAQRVNVLVDGDVYSPLRPPIRAWQSAKCMEVRVTRTGTDACTHVFPCSILIYRTVAFGNARGRNVAEAAGQPSRPICRSRPLAVIQRLLRLAAFYGR